MLLATSCGAPCVDFTATPAGLGISDGVLGADAGINPGSILDGSIVVRGCADGAFI